MNDVILRMEKISKSFSSNQVLKNVDFELCRGEVHALMGENGAGKSTLMNILSGSLKKDSGRIELFGKEVDFPDIKSSQMSGISIIHQELNMMEDLTVAQNVFIGREPMKRGIFIDDKKMERDAAQLLSRLGINISPGARLRELTVGLQQMVEIAKAISFDSKILILDEPTAALTQPEVEELFRIMNDLKEKGIGMIYISHRMDEIRRISDRVTVFRDGEYIGTVNTAGTSKEEIIKMMVGREISGEIKTESTCPENSPYVLEVCNLNRGKQVRNVSFKLKKGEILGFAGLMGAGRTETLRALYGADNRDSGEIRINGELTEIKSPEDAVKHGICYLSEDRMHFGLMMTESVKDNTVIASIDTFIKNGIFDDKEAQKSAEEYNNRLKTKMRSINSPVKNLSGGNQQKVIVARWLLKNCDIFIFDEPTRGIDIGAKNEMYLLVEELAAAGKSVIFVSSEMQELQRLCDRIIVMCAGRISGELDISDATQENIMALATKFHGMSVNT